MKASLTDYTKYCAICGSPSTDVHHLVYGTSRRRLSDEDGLTMPLCRKHHDEMHANGTCGTMSKIIGQLLWEKTFIANGSEVMLDRANEAFRKRYGESYL